MPQILMDTVVASPSAPSTGKITIYAKSDFTLWKRLPDGTEIPLDQDGKATIDSPNFTGNPTVPNQPVSDNDTSIANTAFVHAAIASDRPYDTDLPLMDGVASAGVDVAVSRGDHTHPSDTTKADVTYVNSQDTILDNKITVLETADTKNVKKSSANGAAHIPAGSTAQRPGNPGAGDFRFNESTDEWEGYKVSLGDWGNIGGGQLIGKAPIKGIFYNAQVISETVAIETGTNGMSAGPITVANGFSVEVKNGCTWTVV